MITGRILTSTYIHNHQLFTKKKKATTITTPIMITGRILTSAYIHHHHAHLSLSDADQSSSTNIIDWGEK